MTDLPFQSRRQAGQLLAAELKNHKLPLSTLILALPRGGVPVGFAIAQALHLPMDVLVARKLGVPWQHELAMGALAGESPDARSAVDPGSPHLPAGRRCRRYPRKGGTGASREAISRRASRTTGAGEDCAAGGRRIGHRVHHARRRPLRAEFGTGQLENRSSCRLGASLPVGGK
jgi:hypothetical protein